MHIPTFAEIKDIVGTAKIVFNDALILFHAAPKIEKAVKEKKSVLTVLKEEAPEALAIFESIANIVAPGSGTIIEILAVGFSMSHKMTPEEERGWMARIPTE